MSSNGWLQMWMPILVPPGPRKCTQEIPQTAAVTQERTGNLGYASKLEQALRRVVGVRRGWQGFFQSLG